MAINKVIDRNNNTLIDLTQDTVSASKVLSGVEFHGPDGNKYTGTLTPYAGDNSRYRFFDYDGTLLYSYSDEELDALTSLPAGRDHTEEGLIFQGWNWTLEELKTSNRNALNRPCVGPNLVTDDNNTYLYVRNTSTSNMNFSLYFYRRVPGSPDVTGNVDFVVDWGDGSGNTTTTVKQKYSGYVTRSLSPGNHVIKITVNNTTGDIGIGPSLREGLLLDKIKLGNINGLLFDSSYYNNFDKINIPSSLLALEGMAWKSTGSWYFYGQRIVNQITVPKNIGTTWGSASSEYPAQNYISDTVCFPKNMMVTSLSSNTSIYLYGVLNYYLPENFNDLKYNNHKISLSLSRITNTIVTDVDTVRFNNNVNQYYSDSIRTSINLRNCRDVILSSIGSLEVNNDADFVMDKLSISYLYGHRQTVVIPKVNNITLSSVANVTLDLTLSDTVIKTTSSVSLSNCKILVPMALLDQYKSASYWSSVASYMTGV